eukprot:CAMPEP_0170197786 /NCGR_PEP_ID=MMETSP0040_2-20121228/67203_1 /TAXON_ID=641309 /ORGANISM="Lotharella oceanica, Strain CCMP622" /LENGTH=37 /DNA_ID= /DNA_START= /DNA_END= /DNA_ORIENTATION=
MPRVTLVEKCSLAHSAFNPESKMKKKARIRIKNKLMT